MRRRGTAFSQDSNSSTPNSADPSATFVVGSPWLEPPSISSSDSGRAAYRNGESFSSRSSSGSAAGGSAAKGREKSWQDKACSLLFQLVFWPLTLSLMLAGAAYRCLLQVGCRASPLRFRDPPRWLVCVVSKPFRLINPPVVLGTENLECCLGLEDGDGNGDGKARGRHPPLLLVGNHNLLGMDCVAVLDEVGARLG